MKMPMDSVSVTEAEMMAVPAADLLDVPPDTGIMVEPSSTPADVMQVCLNGHVITAALYSHPDSGSTHCDRCGAETLEQCRTCGEPLRGETPLPGLITLGRPKPPGFCAVCGAAFPWSGLTTPVVATNGHALPDSLSALESLLRRLPRVIRQLRDRHGDRPPFRVADEADLQDLLRALLPLHFDDVRPESRTPPYSRCTRIDFRLPEPKSALTVKLATATLREPELTAQWRDDLAYYRRDHTPATLIGFVYDPQGLLRESAKLELTWSKLAEGLTGRFVIAS